MQHWVKPRIAATTRTCAKRKLKNQQVTKMCKTWIKKYKSTTTDTKKMKVLPVRAFVCLFDRLSICFISLTQQWTTCIFGKLRRFKRAVYGLEGQVYLTYLLIHLMSSILSHCTLHTVYLELRCQLKHSYAYPSICWLHAQTVLHIHVAYHTLCVPNPN